MSVLDLARPALRTLTPYVPATHEEGLVRLNANESPWRLPGDSSTRGLNRYPPARPGMLQSRLAAHYGVRPEQLLVTRGSSEAIDTLIRGFCEARQDRVLITPPTFDLYRVYAAIQGAELDAVPLTEDHDSYRLDIDAVLQHVTPATKIVFLCSPNNPTGQSVPASDLRRLCEALAGRAIVAIDEAYQEFSDTESCLDLARDHEHLVVLRTLSKCLSLAGARCGALIGAPSLVTYLQGVLPPYTFATPSLEGVLDAFSSASLATAAAHADAIKGERTRLGKALVNVPGVLRVYASEANFILVRTNDGQAFTRRAHAGGFLVRTFPTDPTLRDCVRITIGQPADNGRLLATLADRHTRPATRRSAGGKP